MSATLVVGTVSCRWPPCRIMVMNSGEYDILKGLAMLGSGLAICAVLGFALKIFFTTRKLIFSNSVAKKMNVVFHMFGCSATNHVFQYASIFVWSAAKMIANSAVDCHQKKEGRNNNHEKCDNQTRCIVAVLTRECYENTCDDFAHPWLKQTISGQSFSPWLKQIITGNLSAHGSSNDLGQSSSPWLKQMIWGSLPAHGSSK